MIAVAQAIQYSPLKIKSAPSVDPRIRFRGLPSGSHPGRHQCHSKSDIAVPEPGLLPINAPGSSDPTGSFADTGNGQAVANALETASEEMSPPTCANRSRSVAWV